MFILLACKVKNPSFPLCPNMVRTTNKSPVLCPSCQPIHISKLSFSHPGFCRKRTFFLWAQRHVLDRSRSDCSSGFAANGTFKTNLSTSELSFAPFPKPGNWLFSKSPNFWGNLRISLLCIDRLEEDTRPKNELKRRVASMFNKFIHLPLVPGDSVNLSIFNLLIVMRGAASKGRACSCWCCCCGGIGGWCCWHGKQVRKDANQSDYEYKEWGKQPGKC